MVNVLIFGAGQGGRRVVNLLNKEKVKILAFIDNDQKKVGSDVKGIPVVSPQEIGYYQYDYIIIASVFYDEIFDQLIELGVNEEKIIDVFRIGCRISRQLIKAICQYYYSRQEIYKSIFDMEKVEEFSDNFIVCDMVSIYKNNSDLELLNKPLIFGMDIFSKERNMGLYQFPDYILRGIDYVRLSNAELIAKEIKDRNIPGAVAELGVYRGDFTKFISKIFPGRDLYLFDTFGGFDQRDVSYEHLRKFSEAKSGHLSDCTVDLVLSKLTHQQNIFVKKGYFPESAMDVKDVKFAFVSIDVDLFKPTYEGLNFFYDSLSEGGYILIHDYNFPKYSGVMAAVRKFCKEKRINYVPLCDYFGSAVVTK